MGNISVCVLLLIVASAFLPHSSYSHELTSTKREALEVSVGGGADAGNAPSSFPECGECQSPPPSPPPRLKRAKKVLLKFKRNICDTQGRTSNWKMSNDVCKFNGISCATYPNDKQKAVAGLDFNGYAFSRLRNDKPLDLFGILAPIRELAFFHVNSNNFSGQVPPQISQFPYFFELDLSNNKIRGEFPKEVLLSKQLVFLDLRFNELCGSIPPQLFKLPLEVIFINNNQLTGCLPDDFGSTPARYLTFANNKLTGPIPRSIGKATNITEVLFLGNQFSGCLPYEIGFLVKATVFDVSKNWLTGPIPHSFACLDNIQFLNLADNQFYGPVPESVCKLSGLRNGNLTLSGNYFTQVGPECRKLIDAKVLDVRRNCILGLRDQRTQAECTKFFSEVKPCPNPKTLNIVPCNKYYESYETTVPGPVAAGWPPMPVTYKSLKPHRL
ncbi:uncharacterized protein At4g06744-like [Prosopis cineraria]|uniref:uncharacterized protein At4g06744-like n=1 Tax=Prosopis cineraria TaxID=364024 RepID=UPI00240F5C9E|nr:uncharacterized protein At4g06744-like [Prosopis cineraria]